MTALDKLPYTIGLTGGIASGKSAVSKLFHDLGVAVIDTDKISRELVSSGTEALESIKQHFGTQILQSSGELDRGRLRQIIFSEPAQKQWLENLLHPLIRTRAREQLAATTGSYAILVVPLLLESRHYGFVDRVLVVDIPESLQISRVMARDHCSQSVAENILSAQMSRQDRLARADDIIENSSSLKALKHKVLELHEKYQRLSKQRD